MRFDDPALREAYRRGARDAFDSMVVGLNAADARAMAEWLTHLDAWDSGPPPAPPNTWPEDDVA